MSDETQPLQHATKRGPSFLVAASNSSLQQPQQQQQYGTTTTTETNPNSNTTITTSSALTNTSNTNNTTNIAIPFGAGIESKDNNSNNNDETAETAEITDDRMPLREVNNNTIFRPSRWNKESSFFQSDNKAFIYILLVLQIFIIILYAASVTYKLPTDTYENTPNNEDTGKDDYVLFQNINVMMFIGFGYLMTFLKKYGFSSIGYNMLLACFCIEWGMYMTGMVDVLFTGKNHKLEINIDTIAQGDIAAATILISMGAILGRTTPSQLITMAFIEIILYSVNQYIVTELLHVNDVGGSMIIHAFGAYFGLAVSYVLGEPFDSQENSSTYHSDLFSMIGTIFLWMYWPSFNGIFVGDTFNWSQSRAFLNTILSLCSCVIFTFIFSLHLNKKFDMAHLQNSTLAGGVAVGACANLYITPVGALIAGLFAAYVSVIGFHKVQPFLQENRYLFDTCGVNNLHGMPGILGAIISSVAIAAAQGTDTYPDGAFVYTLSKQASMQIAGICVSVGMAVVSGLVTGWILVTFFNDVRTPFSDRQFFSVPITEMKEVYRPFFDTNENGNGSGFTGIRTKDT